MASLSATSLEPPLSPDTAADAHPASKSVRGFARETEGGGSSATEPQILGGENSRDSPNHGIAGDASSGEKLNVSPVTKQHFAGVIWMPRPSPLASPHAYYEEAIRAQHFVPTPENIEVNMFVDGSFYTPTKTGGCAVAWESFVSDSITKRQTNVLAFQMDPSGTNQNAEAAALAESLVQSKKELIILVRKFIAANPHPSTMDTILSKPVTINIFSDCRAIMGLFTRPKLPQGNTARLHVLRRCVVESHNALDLSDTFPGLVVRLNLSWVPAHKPAFWIRLHALADKACREARIHGSFRMTGYDLLKKVAIPLEPSVYASLRHHFLADQHPLPAGLTSAPQSISARPGKRALDQTAQDSGDDADAVGASEPARKKRKCIPASPASTQAPANQTSAPPSISARPGKRALDQTVQDSGDDADAVGASDPPRKKRRGNPAFRASNRAGGSAARPSSAERPSERSTHPSVPPPHQSPPRASAPGPSASSPSVPSRRVLASGIRTRSATQHAEAQRVSKLKPARETATQIAARHEWRPVEGTSVRLEVWMRSVQVQVLDSGTPQRAAIISDGAVLYLTRRGVERYWGWEAFGWRREWVVGLLEEK